MRALEGFASFGVRGDLFALLNAALRVGVNGLAMWPLFCLSKVMSAEFEGQTEEQPVMALRHSSKICKHGGTSQPIA